MWRYAHTWLYIQRVTLCIYFVIYSPCDVMYLFCYLFTMWRYVYCAVYSPRDVMFIVLSIHHVTLCLLCCLLTMWRYMFILLSTPHVKLGGGGGGVFFRCLQASSATAVGNLLSETDIDTCLKRKWKRKKKRKKKVYSSRERSCCCYYLSGPDGNSSRGVSLLLDTGTSSPRSRITWH